MDRITEDEAWKALRFLATSAPEIARARADMIYADEYRKSLKAILMAQSDEKSAAAREQDAYSHPRYTEHLKTYRAAVLEYEKLRAQREGATMKIEVFRTISANTRKF